MNDSTRLPGSEAAPSEGLLRGGIGFFGGLLLCGAALAAQAALLRVIAGEAKKATES